MILEAYWTIGEDEILPRTTIVSSQPAPIPSTATPSTNDRDWNRFLRIIVHAITPFPDALRALGDALLTLPPDLRGQRVEVPT